MGAMQHRPTLKVFESTLPYASFYHCPPAVIPEDVLNGIRQSHYPAALTLPFEKLNALLDAGYLALKNGWARMPEGVFFVAVRKHIPEVTKDMLDWWLWWHAQEPLRYRIWYPEAHFGISGDETRTAHVKDRDESPRYWHVTALSKMWASVKKRSASSPFHLLSSGLTLRASPRPESSRPYV